MKAQTAPIASGRNGVIQVLTPESRSYYKVEDVKQLLGVKQSKAYAIIQSLRKEMIASGYLTVEYPVGQIPKKYFNARCGID